MSDGSPMSLYDLRRQAGLRRRATAAWSGRRSCAGSRARTATVLTADRAELDLREQAAVDAGWFAAERARRGLPRGGAGRRHPRQRHAIPADFLYDNLAIETNVIDAAHALRAWRSCCSSARRASIRKTAPQPIARGRAADRPARADQRVVRGRQDRRRSSCAQAYRRQYGCDFISRDADQPLRARRQLRSRQPAMCCPALIRKAHEAKLTRARRASTIWGTRHAAARVPPRRRPAPMPACFLLQALFGRRARSTSARGEDLSIAELARAGRARWSASRASCVSTRASPTARRAS